MFLHISLRAIVFKMHWTRPADNLALCGACMRLAKYISNFRSGDDPFCHTDKASLLSESAKVCKLCNLFLDGLVVQLRMKDKQNWCPAFSSSAIVVECEQGHSFPYRVDDDAAQVWGVYIALAKSSARGFFRISTSRGWYSKTQ
jgi:hypothetical protein